MFDLVFIFFIFKLIILNKTKNMIVELMLKCFLFFCSLLPKQTNSRTEQETKF